MSEGWTLADLRGTAIMDEARTGAVATRNGRRLAEAAGLAVHNPAHIPGPPPGEAGNPRTGEPGKPGTQVARNLASPAPDGWLCRLMACDGWDGRRRPLSPEEQLSALVATELRRLTLAGELGAIWTCHQLGTSGETAAGRMAMRLARVLGVVPGAPDWWFLWGGGAGLIELKVERPADLLDLRKDGTARAPTRTYMRPVQRDFREWAVSLGVKHAVARTVPEVLATLREWGRLL